MLKVRYLRVSRIKKIFNCGQILFPEYRIGKAVLGRVGIHEITDARARLTISCVLERRPSARRGCIFTEAILKRVCLGWMRGAAPLRYCCVVSSDDGGQPGGCVRSEYDSRHHDTARRDANSNTWFRCVFDRGDGDGAWARSAQQ